jgi:hypothetical protein
MNTTTTTTTTTTTALVAADCPAATTTSTSSNCTWSPNNIPVLVENALGVQFTINVMNYIGVDCVHYLHATDGLPRSREDRFADRVFVVGCYENTSQSRKEILGPMMQLAIAKAGFQVSAEKGFRYDNNSLAYYCTRFRMQRQGRKTGGKSGKVRNTTTTKPANAAERCKFNMCLYWDETLHRWYIWPSGSGYARHSGHLPVVHRAAAVAEKKKNKLHRGSKAAAATEAPPQQQQEQQQVEEVAAVVGEQSSETAAAAADITATTILAATSCTLLPPMNVNNSNNSIGSMMSPADMDLREKMARNERTSYCELLPDFMEITKMCDGDFEVFQRVRAAMTKMKCDVAQVVQEGNRMTKRLEMDTETTTSTNHKNNNNKRLKSMS